jgi:drug/metabolite transporter (DMT)-like permease
MKYYFYLILATFFWGSTFSITKYLLDYYSSFFILFFRFFISSLLVYLFNFKLINKNIVYLFTDKIFILFGVCNFLAYFLQTQGLKYTSASNTAFITATSCLLVPFVKKIHSYKTYVSFVHYISIFIALLGIYFLSFGFTFTFVFNLGDILVLISAIMYSYFIIYLEILTKKHKNVLIVFFMFTSIALPSFTGLFGSFVNIFSIKSMIFLLILSLLCTLYTNILIVKGQCFVSSEKAALIYTLEPIFALIFAVIFINELLTLNLLIGSLLVLIAILFSLVFDRKKELVLIKSAIK